MEPQAALVGAEGAVELDPEAPVDVDLAVGSLTEWLIQGLNPILALDGVGVADLGQ
jgi:hypothetical protein